MSGRTNRQCPWRSEIDRNSGGAGSPFPRWLVLLISVASVKSGLTRCYVIRHAAEIFERFIILSNSKQPAAG
jgi:hypothetical protein